MNLIVWIDLEPGHSERWLWWPYFHRNYSNLHLFEWGRWVLCWDWHKMSPQWPRAVGGDDGPIRRGRPLPAVPRNYTDAELQALSDEEVAILREEGDMRIRRMSGRSAGL